MNKNIVINFPLYYWIIILFIIYSAGVVFYHDSGFIGALVFIGGFMLTTGLSIYVSSIIFGKIREADYTEVKKDE
jgi:hypothetical protein